MLHKPMLAALALIICACAAPPPKSDISGTRRQTAELKSQLDNPVIQEEVQNLARLPQPERWEKAKELLANKHILATCAFDKDHPVPQDPTRGAYALVPC